MKYYISFNCCKFLFNLIVLITIIYIFIIINLYKSFLMSKSHMLYIENVSILNKRINIKFAKIFDFINFKVDIK